MLGSFFLMCSSPLESLFLIQAISRKTPPCGLPRPALISLHDAARDVITGQQLRRPARVFVALAIAPAFLLVIGRLRSVVLRDVVKHEAAAFVVRQDAAFAAHAFGHENAAHARRPDHAGWMELDELHVDQLRAGVVALDEWPSPVYSQLLLVILKARPIPPVARTTALARKTLKRPRSRS